jgi:hypothetical protein
MSLALFAPLTSLAGGIVTSPLAFLSLLPLVAVGINYFRYNNVDPETGPVDAVNVSISQKKKTLLFTNFSFFLPFSCDATTILL